MAFWLGANRDREQAQRELQRQDSRTSGLGEAATHSCRRGGWAVPGPEVSNGALRPQGTGSWLRRGWGTDPQPLREAGSRLLLEPMGTLRLRGG